MVKNELIILFLFIITTLSAQDGDPVLMRVNGRNIHRSEFEYFYNKNREEAGEKKGTAQDYVNQFTDFKLKVAAAESEGIDTTRFFCNQLSAFRGRLAQSYLLNRPEVGRAALRIYNEMKANHHAGEVKITQIFKHLPQTISASALRQIEQSMDSIYNSLQKDSVNFELYVGRFSDDRSTPWVKTLQMTTEFENIVFGLKVGEISCPFFTPQGIYIVKVLAKRNIPPFSEIKDTIIHRLATGYAMNAVFDSVIEQLKSDYHYSPDKQGLDELYSKGYTARNLFMLDKHPYSGRLFKAFATSHPAKLRDQLTGFIAKSVLAYADSCLERRDPQFRLLMQEYKERLLVSEVTNRVIGNQATVNEENLAGYFEKHRSDYNWAVPRYKGIVICCSSKRVARRARKLVKSLSEEEWMDAIRLMLNSGEQPLVKACQGLFSPGDNAFVDAKIFRRGSFVPMPSFPYIVLSGKKLKGPRDYSAIRSLVVVDYQKILERRWNEQLRKGAKVEINQEVLKTVNNH